MIRSVFTVALSIVLLNVSHAVAQEVAVFEVDLSIHGKQVDVYYVFTARGVAIQLLRDKQVPAATGLCRYDEENNLIHITWLRLQKPLAVQASEVLRVDATTKEIEFQIKKSTDEKIVGSVIAAKQSSCSEKIKATFNKHAETTLKIVTANAEWQKGMQEDQLRLLLEWQKGMNRAGWRYVETFGKKLGL